MAGTGETLREAVARTARAEGPAAAVAMVEARAAGDDPDALLMLGEWRLYGMGRPTDLAGGYAAVARAAALGSVEAGLAEVALRATGTGVAPDPAGARARLEALAARSSEAAAQLRLVNALPAAPAEPEILSDEPWVARFDRAVPAEHCAYLISRAGPLVQPSTVIDPRTRARVPNPVRTSDGAAFSPLAEDLVIHGVNARLGALSGTAVERGEPLHVLRYRPGQEYRPHLDALPGGGNQRSATVLLYLNDGYAGGETDFPLLGVTVAGRTGDVLVFRNTGADGRPDRRTLHAGLPVTRGEKWLATRWVRARPFHPWKAETHG